MVAGEDRRIHHGINLARNAIHAVSKPKFPGCGILDTDLIAAFDWLCLDWVYKVLYRKGLDSKVISRLKNLYQNNISVVVVNCGCKQCSREVCQECSPISSTRRSDKYAPLLFWY